MKHPGTCSTVCFHDRKIKCFQEKEVNSTLSLLESCSKFYREGKLSPRYTGKDVPRGCSQNQDVYNIMQYIVDVDFLPVKVNYFLFP